MTHDNKKENAKGKAKEASERMSGGRSKEAAGAIEQAKAEIRKRMTNSHDRPVPQEPPD
ncbi:hypothetical protein ACF1BP_30955 [Streptomyces sp. NPDC014735]|uniref:hypothetical protein n=1 Tax=unclassified Streptomyces TaxID=2593676 RepID=UPI0036F5AFA5